MNTLQNLVIELPGDGASSRRLRELKFRNVLSIKVKAKRLGYRRDDSCWANSDDMNYAWLCGINKKIGFTTTIPCAHMHDIISISDFLQLPEPNALENIQKRINASYSCVICGDEIKNKKGWISGATARNYCRCGKTFDRDEIPDSPAPQYASADYKKLRVLSESLQKARNRAIERISENGKKDVSERFHSWAKRVADKHEKLLGKRDNLLGQPAELPESIKSIWRHEWSDFTLLPNSHMSQSDVDEIMNTANRLAASPYEYTRFMTSLFDETENNNQGEKTMITKITIAIKVTRKDKEGNEHLTDLREVEEKRLVNPSPTKIADLIFEYRKKHEIKSVDDILVKEKQERWFTPG